MHGVRIPFRPGLHDAHGAMSPAFLALLQEAAQPTAWCLDIGCGEGRVALTLAPLVRWVVGIDLRRGEIKSARERAEQEGLSNAQFLLVDAELASYRDLAPTGWFQLISSKLWLTEAIIKRAAEALSADGRFVATCFEMSQWRETGLGVGGAYSEKRLRRVLAAAGLEPVELAVETRTVEFESVEQLHEYLPGGRIERWRADGRWRNIEDHFAAGERGLTDSRIVFSARRAGGEE